MKTIKRRRKQGKTNYKSRLEMLKGSLPRIAVRVSNRYVVGQYIKSKEAQDSVVFGVNSKELIEYGWPKEKQGGLKSLAACYLTGYLISKKIEEKEAILDKGLRRNVKGSRVYAMLKGLIDGGMKIQHDSEILPKEIKSEGIDINKIKLNIENAK